jgi:hypothetical protein
LLLWGSLKIRFFVIPAFAGMTFLEKIGFLDTPYSYFNNAVSTSYYVFATASTAESTTYLFFKDVANLLFFNFLAGKSLGIGPANFPPSKKLL